LDTHLRALIISDLNPTSGWGRAALDLSKNLPKYGFEVLLYPTHESRKKVPLSNGILSTSEFLGLRDSSYFDLIIHFDLPSKWMKYKHAKSVGYFFWESGSLPRAYVKQFQIVDQIWVPSDWQKKLILSFSPDERVFKVPIPLTAMSQPSNVAIANKENNDDYVLWMGTLEPRKGLRNFLRDWGTYKSNGGLLQLKLKVSSNNVTHTPKDIDTLVGALFKEIGLPKRTLLSIDGLFSRLSRKDIEALYASTKSVIGSSFGEGFGFVPVDGVISGIPVFWPSNTAIAEWMPSGTRGSIECVRYTSFLKGDQMLYENPIWYPPMEGAIEKALWASEEMLEVETLSMNKVQLHNLTNFMDSTEILSALDEIALAASSGDRK
jgi:glycosyltransferase involved in cell wall biosynthesis